MSNLLMDTESEPATPAAGQSIIWTDNQGLIICQKNANGEIIARSKNASVTNQAPGAVDTYITGSNLLIPSFSTLAKTIITWIISASKTAAGVATPNYIIRIGAAGAIGDTARLTLVGPAQTAIADIGLLIITAIVRNKAVAGVIQGSAAWSHQGTTASSTIGTGFANNGNGEVEGTSAGFDNTALGGQFIGLSINAGAAAAWTITQTRTEAQW
jgi:hypothetical protein